MYGDIATDTLYKSHLLASCLYNVQALSLLSSAHFLPTILVPPSAPQNVRVSAYSWDSLELSWDAPLQGADALSCFTIESRMADQPTFRLQGKVDAFKPRKYQAYGLFEGEDYFFRIRGCTKSGGPSEDFAEIGPVTPRPPYGKVDGMISSRPH